MRFGAGMTGLEALMWRLGGRDPSMVPWMRMHVGLECPVPLSVVAGRLEDVTLRVPRLRERVLPAPLPTLPPRWQPDPEFDLRNHLSSTVLEAPPPLDRPPWRAVLSDPSLLELQLHHSYTDGLGGIRLLGELFDGPRLPLEPPPLSTPDPPPSRSTDPPPSSMPDPLEELLARSVGAISRALTWSVAALADPSSVSGLVPGGRSSPLLEKRSGESCLARLPVSLQRLRDTGKRLGATVNDVYLSGLLEGLARYHDKHMVTPPPTIRLGVPMSTRAGGPVVEMSNHVQGTLLAAPLGCLDFDERTRLLHEMMRLARSRQPASSEFVALLDDLAGVASACPGADLVAAAVMRRVDVLASNLAGPADRLSLCGTPVLEMTPYGPRSGAALNATLLSYAGVAFIGLNIDPASFTQPDVLVDCLRSAFEEVLG